MFFNFKNFLKSLTFILILFFAVIVSSTVSYFIIDITNQKKNLMDIEEYSPISSLVVPENPVKKAKFPFANTIKLNPN